MNHFIDNKGDIHSQHTHANKYCPSCHVFGSIQHEDNCNGQKVRISATARIPRKNASKKVWDDFYDKFVLQKDLREFLAKPKKRTKWNKQRETWQIQYKISKNKK